MVLQRLKSDKIEGDDNKGWGNDDECRQIRVI